MDDAIRAVKLLVIVASSTGRTRRIADAVAEGAREVGAQVLVRAADAAQEADLLEADAVILGSGVHMGGIESSMRQFFERMAPLWIQGALVGKVGAAFASAGEGGRGGTELALISLLANLAEHGMVLVSMPNRLEGYRDAGCHWGPAIQTNPRGGPPGPGEADLRAARAHGRHVAETASRFVSALAQER